MATFYFAEDGNWGDATDLILIDEDDYKFTDAMWDCISESGDNSRMEIVQHFIDVANDVAEHDWDGLATCTICELNGKQLGLN